MSMSFELPWPVWVRQPTRTHAHTHTPEGADRASGSAGHKQCHSDKGQADGTPLFKRLDVLNR
eukprot:1144545-Pelagomonas_calceolata.AAC.2